ncbi:hypothetical protein KEJ18_04375 [Candidatus Bathyarchaeota archaeon]|nr:hypothetical protein [Candidatus Bathyarchaeota archaeon]
MGRLSEAIFGRKKLPERCVIYAGSYIPRRKDWVKSLFDRWQRIRGHWVKYSFASSDGIEFLLIFNVYGAAMVLEIIQLLKDGEAKRVFFVGALGGKDLPVGTLVLPTRTIDKTGFVSLDDPNRQIVEPKKDSLERLRKTIKNLSQIHVEGTIVSVPCVLHNIDHIKKFVEENSSILGAELETSTFYHYSQKEHFESYALLYIGDNKKHDIISGAKNVQEARKRSLKTITKVAVKTLK